jgi:hypothetical protein
MHCNRRKTKIYESLCASFERNGLTKKYTDYIIANHRL